jgi:hypothetical protein
VLLHLLEEPITDGMEVSQVPHHRRKLQNHGVFVHNTTLLRDVITVCQDLFHELWYIVIKNTIALGNIGFLYRIVVEKKEITRDVLYGPMHRRTLFRHETHWVLGVQATARILSVEYVVHVRQRMLENEKKEYVTPKDLVHHPRVPVIYALSRAKVVDALHDTSKSGEWFLAVCDSPDTRVVLLLVCVHAILVYSRKS